MNRELKSLIKDDVFRNTGGKRNKPALFKNNNNLKYLRALRCCQYYKDKRLLSYYYRFRLELISKKSFIQISREAKIGRGLYIGHFGRVIVSSGASIGDNVNISTGITIGKTNRGNRMGCPIIGNNVWIGTNAVIVGKISIGDDVLIAPNAYVNTDIPSHSIVIGNPAQIIPRENATEGYIKNCV